MSIYESVFKDLFLTILELIDYSYSEMLNDNVEFHLNESGSDSLNDMHLENSITNRLVVYIQKNKIRYGLEILGFEVEPASDLSKEFATKGFIDIKVSNITTYFYNFTDETIYFAFECKRVNKNSQKTSKYVNEGINRLGVETLNKNEEDIDINYAYCYVSTHSRENSDEITLYHLFYDFSDMIKQAN